MIDLVAMRINYDTDLEDPCSVLCDSVVCAEVDVVSYFPGPVKCNEVAVTVKVEKNASENKLSKTNGKKSVTEKTETAEGEKLDGATPSKLSSSSNDLIPIKEQFNLKQDGGLNSVALVCPSAHQLLG